MLSFAILEDVIDPVAADTLAEDIERLERELRIEPAQDLFEGLRTRRVYNLLARGERFERAVEAAAVLDVVERSPVDLLDETGPRVVVGSVR